MNKQQEEPTCNGEGIVRIRSKRSRVESVPKEAVLNKCCVIANPSLLLDIEL